MRARRRAVRRRRRRARGGVFSEGTLAVRQRRRRRAAVLAASVVAVLVAVVGLREEVPEPQRQSQTIAATATERAPSSPPPFARPAPTVAPYEPDGVEPYANGKRLAGRVAQKLATFAPGSDAADLIGRIRPDAMALGELERVVAPLVDRARRSTAEVVYAQLSGVTESTLGVMVLVRQYLDDAVGRRREVVRVFDVRLHRTGGGAWQLDRVGSVGGRPSPRPRRLSPTARRVLDHRNVVLSDTARWEIHRGEIEEGLLAALADVADGFRIAVAVLKGGHPPTVWATDRPSAHTAGLAADVYAVDGRLVLHQRGVSTPAHRLATALLAGGAQQVGSPWVLPPGGDRSFTDAVHQDHLHVQQTAMP